MRASMSGTNSRQSLIKNRRRLPISTLICHRHKATLAKPPLSSRRACGRATVCVTSGMSCSVRALWSGSCGLETSTVRAVPSGQTHKVVSIKRSEERGWGRKETKEKTRTCSGSRSASREGSAQHQALLHTRARACRLEFLLAARARWHGGERRGERHLAQRRGQRHSGGSGIGTGGAERRLSHGPGSLVGAFAGASLGVGVGRRGQGHHHLAQ